MSLWSKFFGKSETQAGNDLSDLPKYWQWLASDNPIKKFTGIGWIEMVFREHPEAIGGQEHKKSVEILKGVLNARNKGLQAEALTVLALIKAVDTLPQIIEKTNDPNPNVREKAIWARDKLQSSP